MLFLYICFLKFDNLMTTITIKVNERTKAGKAFMAMSENFFKGVKGIEIVETEDKFQEETYNPEFVKMVLDAAKTKKRTVINPNDIWGSLGLK
jgi:hypothetical protein